MGVPSVKWWTGVLVLVSIAAALVTLERVQENPAPDGLDAVMTSAPVRLTDDGGRAATDGWFVGHRTFVYFGFTSCPDVCPATIAQLGIIKRTIAERHPDIPTPRYVFVTVDRQRDTPARLAAYLRHVGPDFIGVTGEEAQIKALEKPMTAFRREGTPSLSGGYRVSHGGQIFPLDPSARVYARFMPPVKPVQVFDQLNDMVTPHARDAAAATTPST